MSMLLLSLTTLLLYISFSGCFVYDHSLQRFKNTPKNITVVEGEDVVLPCHVINKAGVLAWSRDSQLLGKQYDRKLGPFPRYSLIGSTDEVYDLLIENVSLADEGIYKCQVSSYGEHSQLQKVTSLQITVPPKSVTMFDKTSEKHHNNHSIIGNNTEIVYSSATSSLTLSCRSDFSKPRSSIFWYKNGKEFGTASIRQTFEMGQDSRLLSTESRLTFHLTQMYHNNVISCLVVQSDKRTLTVSTTLKLLFHPEKIEIVQANSQPLVANKSATFKCISVGGNPLPQIQWTKEHQLLTDTHQMVSKDTVTSQVTFKLSKEDNGVEVICEAFSGDSWSVNASHKLIVAYPPTKATILSVFDKKTIEGVENTSLGIKCQAHPSVPPANISWFIVRENSFNEPYQNNIHTDMYYYHTIKKDYYSYNTDNKIANSVIETTLPNPVQSTTKLFNGKGYAYQTSSHVTFKPSSRDHSGKVICRATNQVTGSSVQDVVELDIKYKPYFSIPKNFTADENTSFSMTLTVKANPEVQSFYWKIKNEQKLGPIYKTGSFVIKNSRVLVGMRKVSDRNGSYQQVYLNISKVIASDAGNYVVEAINDVASTILETYLTVYYEPQITKVSEGPTIREGYSATIECSYLSNPPPARAIWYRNNRVVSDNDATVSLTNRENGKAVLKFDRVNRNNIGLYRCMLIGRQTNVISTSIPFNVIYTPEILNKELNNVTSSEVGETVVLRCAAHGATNITWSKLTANRLPSKRTNIKIIYPEVIENLEFSISTDTQESTFLPHTHFPSFLTKYNSTMESMLEIKSIKESDYASYNCKASNEHSDTDFIVTLQKPGPPQAVREIRVTNVTSTSISLSWLVPFNGGSPQSFKITLSSEYFFTNSLSKSQKSQISKQTNNVDEKDMLKNEKVFNLTDYVSETLISSFQKGDYNFVITDLEASHRYIVGISAFNKYGWSDEKKIAVATSAIAIYQTQMNGFMDYTITLAAVFGLVLFLVFVSFIYCTLKKRTKHSLKEDNEVLKIKQDQQQEKHKQQLSKQSSPINNSNATTLDLIGLPSLVDDVINFKPNRSVHYHSNAYTNSCHENSFQNNTTYSETTFPTYPKYGRAFDDKSDTSCRECTTSEELTYAEQLRRCQLNYTPTNSLLNAATLRITNNPYLPNDLPLNNSFYYPHDNEVVNNEIYNINKNHVNNNDKRGSRSLSTSQFLQLKNSLKEPPYNYKTGSLMKVRKNEIFSPNHYDDRGHLV